jgi:hypothetical protein
MNIYIVYIVYPILIIYNIYNMYIYNILIKFKLNFQTLNTIQHHTRWKTMN